MYGVKEGVGGGRYFSPLQSSLNYGTWKSVVHSSIFGDVQWQTAVVAKLILKKGDK